jgi:hypothetical protein
MPDDFSFAVGDRVVSVFPINSGKIGTVTGQWTDLMYTVKWDRGGEDIVEEARLVSLDDFNATRARR